MKHPSDDELVLFYYRESPDAKGVAAHLEGCAGCRASLDAIARTLDAVGNHPVPELGDGYAAQVWARIEPRLEAVRAPWWQSWVAPRRLALAASVALLVVAAFVAGRFSSRSAQPVNGPGQASVQPRNAAQPASETVRDRVLMIAVGEHLERSQMVLVELMNGPSQGVVDISGAQEWARDLVPANRLIRQTANETGERGVADVLTDLERTLVEIANSPSKLPGPELQRIRERVESEGLVFKIRVLDSQVQGREQPPTHGTRSRS
jgi:hypothetical protein